MAALGCDTHLFPATGDLGPDASGFAFKLLFVDDAALLGRDRGLKQLGSKVVDLTLGRDPSDDILRAVDKRGFAERAQDEVALGLVVTRTTRKSVVGCCPHGNARHDAGYLGWSG